MDGGTKADAPRDTVSQTKEEVDEHNEVAEEDGEHESDVDVESDEMSGGLSQKATLTGDGVAELR